MTLSAAQLADLVEKAKAYNGIADDDEAFKYDALAVYHDGGNSSTAATVQIESSQMDLVITGGPDAGTSSFDLTNASYDTLTELVAAINALAKGFVATLLSDGDQTSSLLYRLAATSIWGQAAEQTLQIENNALLELLITNLWAGLEKYLDRQITSGDFTELLYPTGSIVALSQPTVTSFGRLGIDLEDGLKVKYTGSDTNARVEVTETAVVTVSRVGATETATTSTFAANASTADMATTINALSGWTGTVVNSRPSAYLARTAAMDAKDTEVTLECWEDYDGDYQVDYMAGIVELPFERTGRVYCAYTAGYATIPSDIELVILAATKLAWDSRSKDGALESEKLGDHAYKFAAVSGAAGAVDWSVFDSMLDSYRRVLA